MPEIRKAVCMERESDSRMPLQARVGTGSKLEERVITWKMV